MNNSIKTFFSAAAVLALTMSGCYSFSGGRLDFRTVGIPVVENTTAEYRLSEIMTTTMITAVNNDGRFKVSDPEKAEAVLELAVTGYARAPFEYTSQEQVNQYKVTVTAKAKLRSAAGKVLWESAGLSGWIAYPVSESDEESGMKKAAENLAAEIIRQSFESW
jgi:outer membrane lipopolysaccharide assembly protein LptE/RlpB